MPGRLSSPECAEHDGSGGQQPSSCKTNQEFLKEQDSKTGSLG